MTNATEKILCAECKTEISPPLWQTDSVVEGEDDLHIYWLVEHWELRHRNKLNKISNWLRSVSDRERSIAEVAAEGMIGHRESLPQPSRMDSVAEKEV